MNWRATLWVILAAATLILIAVAPVSAGDKVTWYWEDADAGGFTYPGGHQFDKFMNTTEEPESDIGNTVTLGEGESVWWYAHEAAECDLQFHAPPGTWKVTYWVTTNSVDEHSIYVRLYVVKANGDAILINKACNKIKPYHNPKRRTVDMHSGALDLNQGDRLAVEIQWSDGADDGDTLTVYYNSTSYDSQLVSPTNSPPYPVPEPSILTLIAVGLMLFVCISGFKRLN